MPELGIAIPAQSSVHISPWMRLQARIAPVDRLLAAREAAEDDEVGDLYKRTTGDATTDALLREIRREERSHSRAVGEIRSGTVSEPGEPPTARLSPPPAAGPVAARQDPRPRGLAPAGWRLDRQRDLRGQRRPGGGFRDRRRRRRRDRRLELRAHRRPAGAIASALSMATGAYLAERSRGRGRGGEPRPRTRRRSLEHPEEEKEELVALLPAQGDRRGDRRRDGRAALPQPRCDAAGDRRGGVRRDRATAATRSRRRSPAGSPPGSARSSR